ncbi:MAG: diguanylate cyclase [Nitrospiraceae bacterium]|nr:MAG: diguanylate cyclase [Nitrospiraceae bacterium]
MKLRAIIMVLALLSFSVTSAGGYFFYLSLKKSTVDEANIRAAALAKDLAVHIDSLISDNQKSVRLMAGHEELRQALIKGTAEGRARAHAVLDLFQSSLDLDVCYLLDSEGTTVASSNRNDPDSFMGKNYSFRPYFRDAMEGRSSTYMARGVTSGKGGIYFSAPVFDAPGGAVMGVAVIKASVEGIRGMLAKDYDGTIMITDPNGLIFIASLERWNYHLLWEEGLAKTGDLAESRQFGEGPWKWTGLKRQGHQAVDAAGNVYHVHKALLSNYPGWNVTYLHDHRSASQRMSSAMFRAARSIIMTLVLVMGASVLMLYRKATEEIRVRKQLEDRLRDMSVTDDLTGVYNRRGFLNLARHQYNLANRSGFILRLYYLDVDGMKQINDTFGHRAGDEALRDTADILKGVFRKSDILGRIGGDEFSVLMAHPAEDKEGEITARLQQSIEEFNGRGARPFTLQVSIGFFSYYPGEKMTFEEFISRADAMMYERKRSKHRE